MELNAARNKVWPVLVAFVVGVTVGVGIGGNLAPKADAARSESRADAGRSLDRAPMGAGDSDRTKPDGAAAVGGRDAGARTLATIPDGGMQAWSAALRELTSPAERDRFLFSLNETLARSRPDEVIEFLRQLPPSISRSGALEHALGILAETAPEKALGLVGGLLQGMDANNAYVSIAETWGEIDPRSALAWAARQGDAALGQLAAENIVAAATRIDPAQARDAVAAAQDLSPEQRRLAVRAVAGVWAQTDGPAAIAYAKSAGSGDAVGIAYLNWASKDPARAAAQAAGEDAETLAKIGPQIAGLWAHHEPQAAAEWLGKLPVQAGAERAWGEVAGSWAQADPRGALDWAMTLPADGAARAAAVQSAATSWSRMSPDAFKQRLAALPPDARTEIEQALSGGRPPEAAREPGPRAVGR